MFSDFIPIFFNTVRTTQNLRFKKYKRLTELWDSVHDPEWTQSRMGIIPNGHYSEWAPSE